MTPPSKRKAKERQAKRDAGLVRVEVWVRREHVSAVKSYSDRLSAGDGANPPPISGTFPYKCSL